MQFTTFGEKNYPLVILVTLVDSLSQHKQRNLVWTKGTDALEGELQSSSEVDFYIDQVKKTSFHESTQPQNWDVFNSLM